MWATKRGSERLEAQVLHELEQAVVRRTEEIDGLTGKYGCVRAPSTEDGSSSSFDSLCDEAVRFLDNFLYNKLAEAGVENDCVVDAEGFRAIDLDSMRQAVRQFVTASRQLANLSFKNGCINFE